MRQFPFGGLIGLLMVVLVLGLSAGIVFSKMSPSSPLGIPTTGATPGTGSPRPPTGSMQFTLLTDGDAKGYTLSLLGRPCRSGTLSATSPSAPVVAGATYGVWRTDGGYELVVFATQAQMTPGLGSLGAAGPSSVAGKFVAPSGVNWCDAARRPDPYRGSAWSASSGPALAQ